MRALSETKAGDRLASRKMSAAASPRLSRARRSHKRPRFLGLTLPHIPYLSNISPQALGLGATLALMVSTGVYGAILGGHIQRLKEASTEGAAQLVQFAGFGVGEVRVTGAHQMTVPEVLERIGVTSKSVTLGFDAERARRRLVEISWIKSAAVRVLFPGTIDVSLVEREPFALWQRGGRINLVDREGDVIGPYEDERFANLPVVVGEGAEKRLVEIRQLLDPYPGLRGRVRAAVLVAERRWTLKMTDGVDVMLPEEGAKDALGSLARLDQQSDLLKRDIAAVDLRIANRVSVRLTDRATQIRGDGLKVRTRSPSTGAVSAPIAKPQARAI